MYALLAFAHAHVVLLSAVSAIVMANVGNALMKYPKVEFLGHTLLDLASFLTRSDSPGTLKLPGMRSVNPNQMTMPAIPPREDDK